MQIDYRNGPEDFIPHSMRIGASSMLALMVVLLVAPILAETVDAAAGGLLDILAAPFDPIAAAVAPGVTSTRGGLALLLSALVVGLPCGFGFCWVINWYLGYQYLCEKTAGRNDHNRD